MQIPEQTDKTKWSVGRMEVKMINNDDEYSGGGGDDKEKKEEEGEDKRQK